MMWIMYNPQSLGIHAFSDTRNEITTRHKKLQPEFRKLFLIETIGDLELKQWQMWKKLQKPYK